MHPKRPWPKMLYNTTAWNRKLTRYLGRIKMAFGDPRHHMTIARILLIVSAKNLHLTILFVDFAKAFDSIHRGKMEQILLAYGLPIKNVAAIMMLFKITKVKVRSPDEDTDYFNIVASLLHRDTLASCLFIILERLLIKWKTTVSIWQRKEADDTLHIKFRTWTTPMT